MSCRLSRPISVFKEKGGGATVSEFSCDLNRKLPLLASTLAWRLATLCNILLSCQPSLQIQNLSKLSKLAPPIVGKSDWLAVGATSFTSSLRFLR